MMCRGGGGGGGGGLLDGENLEFAIVRLEWCGWVVFMVNVYMNVNVGKDVIRRSGVEWLVFFEVRERLGPLVNTLVTALV